MATFCAWTFVLKTLAGGHARKTLEKASNLLRGKGIIGLRTVKTVHIRARGQKTAPNTLMCCVLTVPVVSAADLLYCLANDPSQVCLVLVGYLLTTVPFFHVEPKEQDPITERLYSLKKRGYVGHGLHLVPFIGNIRMGRNPCKWRKSCLPLLGHWYRHYSTLRLSAYSYPAAASRGRSNGGFRMADSSNRSCRPS